MAYNPCTASIAMNIVANCEKPNVGGYTGRAVLIPVDANPTIVVDEDNDHILTSITLPEGVKSIAVNNVFAEPFTGSNTASQADSGRTSYTKTLAVRIPLRGGQVSKDIVEPLSQNALGYIMIAEKKDRVGDGSYEVIGYLNGLKANADGVTRDELANGGDIVATLSTVEPFFEVTLFDTDYQTTKAMFETLYTTNAI